MSIRIPALATAILLLAAPANAQPPPWGWVGAFPRPSILCDTSEEVQSILTAFETGVGAGAARFAELYRKINTRREPTCAVTSIRTATAVGSTTLGRVSIAGNEGYGWIVHIKNGASDGYYLYLESRAEALKNTI